jgi:hypothetical protein
MVDIVIRAEVRHGKLIVGLALFLVVILAISLLWFTSIFEVLMAATPEFKLFTLFLILTMFLVYFVNIRKSTKVRIEKRIYRYLFFVTSLVTVTAILIVANGTFGRSQRFTRDQFIDPAVQEVVSTVKNQKKERLLKRFREQYKRGECVEADYSYLGLAKDQTVGLSLVATDSELAYGEVVFDSENSTAYLKGKACSDGENTFLLTEQGSWYWVIE